VIVPINVGEDDKRIGYILKNSHTKLAFVRREFFDRVKRILEGSSEEILIIRVEEHQPDAANSPFLGEADSDAGPGLDDEALIVYTSGTTGNPKGVVLTHRNLLVDAKEIAAWHGLTAEQRMMCVLPLHHVNGTVVTLMTPLYAGASVVLNQKFQTRHFFSRIAKERVNVVSVVPTLLQFLLHEDPDLTHLNLQCLRHIICGAGPLTVELAEQFERKFEIQIIHGYGLSETTCYSCFLPIDLSPTKHTQWLKIYGFPSIGVPLPSNEMSIHDAHGAELSENVKGEIVIRGHNVMKEYYENREANESAFAHGWFRSGDEGFYSTDERGRKFFFISGRIKELIIRGGTNISPFEIDEVLMNIPGVKAGLAVGFENDWYGEEIAAYIQLKEGTSNQGITEADVIAHCRKFFSFQKCPKVVVFGSEIPVTSTGKYQRNKLRPLFAEWKKTQFREEEIPTAETQKINVPR
jgi:long-chain acyl-CoA synthetase